MTFLVTVEIWRAGDIYQRCGLVLKRVDRTNYEKIGAYEMLEASKECEEGLIKRKFCII